jgi:hypothetical protein
MLGIVKYWFKASGSTLDSYGPRTNANLEKFIVTDFGSMTDKGK